MKIRKYSIPIVLAAITLLSSCGESLKDTYREYAGNGEIRYLGGCSELTVSPGWKRMVVNWVNNIDPVIDKICVSWSLEGEVDSILLDRGTTTFNIDHMNGKELTDGSYEITVHALDKNGNHSIASTTIGRPYTYDHESVQAFNRLVSKIYMIGNRMVLSFLPWPDGIKEASLTYTCIDGSEGSLPLTQELIGKGHYLLEDEINPKNPVYVNRRGELPGSIDEIEFEPYELSSERTFNADFIEDMRRQYGFDEIPASWAEQVETLYLDRDYNSFIDLLNFPRLKKLVLGSRRYIKETEVAKSSGQSKVNETGNSNFALSVLNQLTGLTVDRYNQQYSTLAATSFIEEKGSPTEPSVTLLSLDGATISCQPKDSEGFSSHLEQLLDGDASTYWEPMRQSEAYTNEIIIDLKERKTLKGIKLTQRTYANEQERVVALSNVKIKVSDDLGEWTDATYMEEVVLGNSNGEVNYIPFTANGRTARYVKIIIAASSYFGQYFSSLAEIGLY